MDTQIAQTVSTPPRIFSYAGFWKRFVAYIIDQIIISVLGIFIVIPFLAIIGISLWNRDFEPDAGYVIWMLGAYFTMIITVVVAEWLYYALMESMKGATIGKMALSIVVTDLNGNRISFGRASGRYFAKIISGLTLGIGYIITGFTQKKQALHDIIAGCLVINK
jgi:uncharacterized RDD family membrane protein YckC